MLAIGRALMTNPRLLILDRERPGLAPLVATTSGPRWTHCGAPGWPSWWSTRTCRR
ncbi:MAG: hypothetical protein R3F55_17760 [Alphaproteobacteria bacterium]